MFAKFGDRKHQTFYGICLIFFSLIIFRGLFSLHYFIYSGWDIGIYARAVHQIANDGIFNPYVELINKGIFNDHLDPIIFLAAPFAKLFPANYVVYFFMIISIITAIILFTRFALKEASHPIIALFSISFMLLNDGVVKAIIYPPHPTTWAILPIFFLCYFLYHRNNIGTFLTFLVLCLYKESFPFIGIPLSLILWRRKSPSLSITTVSISFGLIIFHKFYWHEFVGPLTDFGGRLIHLIINDPYFLLQRALSKGNVKMLIYLFGPMTIFAITLRTFNPVYLFVGSPLFLMRFLNGMWHLHYSAAISFFIIFSLFKKNGLQISQKRISSKVLIIPLLFVLTHGAGPGIQAIKVIKKEAAFQRSLKSSFIKMKEFLPLNKEIRILSTGSIIPHLHNYKAYGFSKVPDANIQFDYVIIQKLKGDWYPVSGENRKRIISNISSQEKSILFEDKNLALIKGPLKESQFLTKL